MDLINGDITDNSKILVDIENNEYVIKKIQ